MSAQRKSRDDAKEWPANNELAYLQILHDRVKLLGASSLKKMVWNEIDEELFDSIGERYGEQKLKGKFNRLRRKFREFSVLIQHVGVSWDPVLNKVTAPEDVWQCFLMKGKSYKVFRKKGCEHYDLLVQIFNNDPVAQLIPDQQLHDLEEFQQLREDDTNTLSEGEDESDNLKLRKRRCHDPDYVLSGHLKKKTSTESKMESYVDVRANSMNVMSESSKAKGADHIHHHSDVRATSSAMVMDPYSIELCMEALNMFDDISQASYNACLERFINRDWRVMFMKMSHDRRKGWLDAIRG